MTKIYQNNYNNAVLLTKRCGNCWESVGFIGEALSGPYSKTLGNVDNALQSVATHRHCVVECVVQRVFHFFLKPGFRK